MISPEIEKAVSLSGDILPKFAPAIHAGLSGLPSGFEKRAFSIVRSLYKGADSPALVSFLDQMSAAGDVGQDSLKITDPIIRKLAEEHAKTAGLHLARWADDPGMQYLIAVEFAKRRGVVVKLVEEPLLMAGFVLRVCAENWWRRKLRVLHGRKAESMAIGLGLVGSRAGSSKYYCSDFTVKRIGEQQQRNDRILSELMATNNEGQEYSLKELAELSVSNPTIRRSELMVRMRGFEELAKKYGHSGQFYTLTTPSRFHSWHKKSRERNEKHNGETPRHAAEYLSKVWARVRAKLARLDVRVYGFRVAEPHHEGCPHWHLLLFMPAGAVGVVNKVFRQYAEADSPEEITKKNPNARFEAVAIDPKKGSATGYLAKYISKNIDGFGVDEDFESGESAEDSARRVKGWASCWGIRQFQQIGGASVTVWRELRRLDEQPAGGLELARFCAVSSDWAGFCEAQGGFNVPKTEHAIQLAKWREFDQDTGEFIDSPFNEYGEPAAGRIFGVIYKGVEHVTRIYNWTIERVAKTLQTESGTNQPGGGLGDLRFSGFGRFSDPLQRGDTGTPGEPGGAGIAAFGSGNLYAGTGF